MKTHRAWSNPALQWTLLPPRRVEGSCTSRESCLPKLGPRRQLAYEMLSPIAYLKPALDIPDCHDEKWDALRWDRAYREAWHYEKVVEHIRWLAGKHFDPKVVDVFLSIVPKQ